VFAETLDGGQAFRWYRDSEGEVETWTGAFADCVAQLRLGTKGVEWRAPQSRHEEAARAVPHYLGAQTDWTALADALPWRSDAHLAQCIAVYPGLRLLRQPLAETLLCFLCSATKQIVQIKQMVALLASRHGAAMASPALFPPGRTSLGHRLPTWEEISRVPEKDLRSCLLGFRARYIHQTARFLAERPGWLAETERLPYGEAKQRLLELPGVGEKVADCVLLFGAGKLEAFPVDVWILKTLARRYGLTGWKPSQVAQFGRAHFGPLAGLAQQYLFGWERRAARDSRV
jgi:N-glycosylase/DNA lyase